MTDEIKAGKNNIEYYSSFVLGEKDKAEIPSGTKMYINNIKTDINSQLIINGGAYVIFGPDD